MDFQIKHHRPVGRVKLVEGTDGYEVRVVVGCSPHIKPLDPSASRRLRAAVNSLFAGKDEFAAGDRWGATIRGARSVIDSMIDPTGIVHHRIHKTPSYTRIWRCCLEDRAKNEREDERTSLAG
jgi:hypothetical protein